VVLGTLLPPPPAVEAKPRLTSEEQLTIDIFKRNTPSVVNVTNLAVKYVWGLLGVAWCTCNLLVPQGLACPVA
jgi:hypothetical protein